MTFFFLLIDKKQYFDKKRTIRFQEVHWEYIRGNQMEAKNSKKNIFSDVNTTKDY